MVSERNKWTFWGAAFGLTALVCVPSTVLLQSFKNYRDFLEGYEPVPLKTRSVHFVPHQNFGRQVRVEKTLQFVEFKLKAPKAKKVYLLGDFNAWKEETFPLSKQPQGLWEILLPLPPGRYHYLFSVDGDLKPDPGNPETAVLNSRKTSVILIR
ncbi:MAG: hypothetical protein HY921_09375 [Elusimicrobia bacterium]|nr:hypothetical protein [Elusimicrobiota bacterium]